MKNDEYKVNKKNNIEIKPKFRQISKTELRAFFVEKPFNKVIAIVGCLMTFIYGFFYIWAFFNPYQNLQRIPMAIVNQDANVCMIYKDDKNLPPSTDGTDSLLNAEAVSFDYTVHNQTDCTTQAKMVGKIGYYTSITDEAVTKLNFYNPNTNRFTYDLKVGKVEGDYVRYSGQNVSELDSKYWVQVRIPQGFTQHLATLIVNMNKASYVCFDGFDGNNLCKDGDPTHTLPATELNGLIIKELRWFTNNRITFWGTSRQNFASGMISNFYANLTTSLSAQILPQLMATTLFTMFSYYPPTSTTPNDRTIQEADINRFLFEFLDPSLIPGMMGINLVDIIPVQKRAVALKNILDVAISGNYIDAKIADEIYRFLTGILPISLMPIVNDLFHIGITSPPPAFQIDKSTKQVSFARKEMNYPEFSSAAKSFTETGSHLLDIFKMPYTLVGKQYSQYGIGLGEAFILVDTFIGIFASTIIYNRRSRTPNTRFYQHYLCKMLILQVNMFIQVSILLLMLLPIGFWQLGSAFWLLYLFALYVGFIFTFIVGGIWLAIPDEVSSRVLNMVVLMFNFACGWILFPAFMSNPFYNALSNIMPFTYAMHNMGNIIYGIASGAGQLWYYQADIIKNCLVLLAMEIVMIAITLITLHIRFLRAHYGTRRMSVIYKAMTQVSSTSEYAHKRSVLLILTKDQKKDIKEKVQEILFTNISEKYSYTKLSKRQIKKMERNTID
ncbi:ABC transporter [Spiroplasma endosymbiont of Megaselia nigra]|uniref:ABC transporter n=1 Tax=Spiroplasma endosymbiont of Megaselia nigra TaxID=2478537 RepID=UPI000F86E0EA|nr:ABC transporter [Spiroplasma endosymbiont of Megaselia nigra]RUO86826.1 ABC transporter [Spiroplasma endosymbiont of Megaselia nigra]